MARRFGRREPRVEGVAALGVHLAFGSRNAAGVFGSRTFCAVAAEPRSPWREVRWRTSPEAKESRTGSGFNAAQLRAEAVAARFVARRCRASVQRDAMRRAAKIEEPAAQLSAWSVGQTQMFGKKKNRPADAEQVTNELRCSFCNKTQRQVQKLVAGPNVNICDECVDICLEILARPHKTKTPSIVRDEEKGPDAPPETAVPCSLCGSETLLSHGLVLLGRGVLCLGCVQAVESALSNAPTAS